MVADSALKFQVVSMQTHNIISNWTGHGSPELKYQYSIHITCLSTERKICILGLERGNRMKTKILSKFPETLSEFNLKEYAVIKSSLNSSLLESSYDYIYFLHDWENHKSARADFACS